MKRKTGSSRNYGCCGRINRRVFLADCGMGFTGLVLGAMFWRDGVGKAATLDGWGPPDGKPMFPAKAKSVIWLFMEGGVSHVETFDPKPALNQYAGKTIEETPFKEVLNSPFQKTVRQFVAGDHNIMKIIYPMQVGHRKVGQSGIEISDWWPHLGACIDDLAIIRSVWTTDNDHAAQLQFHTGRHIFDGFFPSIGSWVHYGLGSLNENLPQFIVIGEEPGPCCGGVGATGASYLGPEHAGVQLAIDPENPLPYASAGPGVYEEEQKREFDFINELDGIAKVKYPDDPAMQARIKSYELAFRMQSAIPEVFRFSEESPETEKLYGLDREETRDFGQRCLAARRLVERGVRYVEVFHGGGAASRWDSHSELKKNHSQLCVEVDKPIAGLLKDLKQRGLLDETLVVWGTEFGRTPGVQGAKAEDPKGGRDHNPQGFSVWMAGGGIKGGVAHGATDELGLYAVENRHYVTDIHATVLHQLGLDPRELVVPGQKRLEIDFGNPIKEIIA